jgi:hypothetical protein
MRRRRSITMHFRLKDMPTNSEELGSFP